MYTTDKNQNSSSPWESLESCPEAALCPPLWGTSARCHRTVQRLPTCRLALSTPVALAFCGLDGRRRTARQKESKPQWGCPSAGWGLTQILPRLCPG